MMYKVLLLDLDDTILDFRYAEKLSLRKTLSQFGLDPTPEVCARYSVINRQHWEKLERQELTRQQVLTGRFDVLFGEMGMQVDSQAVAQSYMENLSLGHYFLPGAREAVEELSKKYRLFLASNGTASVQRSRLESAGIGPYFEGLFISQEMGADKPSPDFFTACFSKIPGSSREEILMVGDSLTSDMLGGLNAGIHTCWINPEGKPGREDIPVDYELRSLAELPALLASMEKTA